MRASGRVLAITLFAVSACGLPPVSVPPLVDPSLAPRAVVDRFSDNAAPPFRRSLVPSLPAPGAPIDFDSGAPFVTHGLGPHGEAVTQYELGASLSYPLPLYVLFYEQDPMPVPGQFNIIHFLPGEPEYTDFWRITRVHVPRSYVPNSARSLPDLDGQGYVFERTTVLVNCPVVPEGSTAMLRYGASEDPSLKSGWYRGQLVHYFTFHERSIPPDANDLVPTADRLVSYRQNPVQGDPGSGPDSGFAAGADGVTHDVVSALPTDAAYAPMWNVLVYDNADFASVHDLASATAAHRLAGSAMTVNAPVVKVQ